MTSNNRFGKFIFPAFVRSWLQLSTTIEIGNTMLFHKRMKNLWCFWYSKLCHNPLVFRVNSSTRLQGDFYQDLRSSGFWGFDKPKVISQKKTS